MDSLNYSKAVPGWLAMWGIAIAIFFVAKLAVLLAASSTGTFSRRHLVFLVAWPGMDLETVVTDCPSKLVAPTISEWLGAAINTLTGLGLIFFLIPRLGLNESVLAGGIGMLGIILSLHFGLFHLLSCFWRARGMSAVPIMNRPLASQSLAEFWGRRWNLAFRDLTYRFLFGPLRRLRRPAVSLMFSFLVSGLIHDIVISWPAGAGYGKPTCYFLLQGLGILFEKSAMGRHWGLDHGLPGRIYCLTLVVMPLGWLFHCHFLIRVVDPFLAAMGAVK